MPMGEDFTQAERDRLSAATTIFGIKPRLLLAGILVLSGYIHLWNPAGFPAIFYDESRYVQDAVRLLETGILQDRFYNHPFFGWIAIAGFLKAAGYLEAISTATDPSSLTLVYAIPRLFMGLLAVLDTFLIYKIAKKMFGWRTAAIASSMFAVMPMSWMFRMVLLDSILLPLILSSVLFALYAKDSGRHVMLVTLSGICLGLAILTKIPAFAVIPPVLILICSARPRRHAVLWLVPVILIPAAWPAYAASMGQFNNWANGIMWQMGRDNGGLVTAADAMFRIDPVVMCTGLAGTVFAATCAVLRPGRMRMHCLFVALWFASAMSLFGSIGYVMFFHLGNLIPVLCIAAALLIVGGGGGRGQEIYKTHYTRPRHAGYGSHGGRVWTLYHGNQHKHGSLLRAA